MQLLAGRLDRLEACPTGVATFDAPGSQIGSIWLAPRPVRELQSPGRGNWRDCYKLERPSEQRRLSCPSTFGPTPFDFVFGNLLRGRMFLGFESLYFEHLCLIDGSMV